MNRLSESNLVSINKLITQKENKPFRISRQDALSGVVIEPFRLDAKSGNFVHDGTLIKAAVYGSLIAEGKPFGFCNIKTAIVAMITFLKLNDIVLDNYDDVLLILAERLQKNDKPGVLEWVVSHASLK